MKDFWITESVGLNLYTLSFESDCIKDHQRIVFSDIIFTSIANGRYDQRHVTKLSLFSLEDLSFIRDQINALMFELKEE